MNLNHMLKAAAAGLVFSGMSFAASANLLTNGDFEADVGDVANGDYTVVNSGSGLIAGWTVGESSVDLIRNNYGAIANVSVDLAGTPGPGSLSQSFTAVVGTTYQLTWDYFRNGGGTDLSVSFGDNVVHTFAPATTFYASGTLNWTATSGGPATVRFLSGSGNAGPTIDNVSVTAVPEPETYAMLLAGLGALAFMGRRRKI